MLLQSSELAFQLQVHQDLEVHTYWAMIPKGMESAGKSSPVSLPLQGKRPLVGVWVSINAITEFPGCHQLCPVLSITVLLLRGLGVIVLSQLPYCLEVSVQSDGEMFFFADTKQHK